MHQCAGGVQCAAGRVVADSGTWRCAPDSQDAAGRVGDRGKFCRGGSGGLQCQRSDTLYRANAIGGAGGAYRSGGV